ncbi:MAG TPA: ABC transporter permease [Acidimicrobiales bacterium]|nr:ABC transporter permease [Acidimicrobiales bacterium]
MAALPSEAATPSVPIAAAVMAEEPARSRRGWVHSLDLYIPAGVLVLLLLACFVWPLVYKLPPPVGGSILDASLPLGSPGHILGTDSVGNDIMSRLLYGGRVSFEVMFAVQGIGLVVGGFIGVAAASFSGLAEATVMRVLDVLIAFPAIVIALAIVDGLGAGEADIIWALAVVSIPTFARVARSGAVRVRDQTFVVAARLSGSKRWRTNLRHVLPNILPQLITFAVLGAAIVVILEATISFFGYGIPPPGPSWGNMIAAGQQVMSNEPALLLVPSIVLLVTVVALNTLSEALRARWGVVR